MMFKFSSYLLAPHYSEWYPDQQHPLAQESVRNAESQASPPTYGIRICILTSSPGNFLYTKLYETF